MKETSGNCIVQPIIATWKACILKYGECNIEKKWERLETGQETIRKAVYIPHIKQELLRKEAKKENDIQLMLYYPGINYSLRKSD